MLFFCVDSAGKQAQVLQDHASSPFDGSVERWQNLARFFDGSFVGIAMPASEFWSVDILQALQKPSENLRG